MAQAVISLRPLTGKPWVRFQVSAQDLWRTVTGTDFSPGTGVFPCQGHSSLPEEQTREAWETALSEKECTG